MIDSLSFGGAENVLVTLARQAPLVGLTLDVLALASPTQERATWLPRLQSVGLAPRFANIDRLREPQAIPQLAREIRNSGCDIVHAHLETATTLAPLAARVARRPAVCTLHHVPVPLHGREALRERLAVEVGSRSDGLLFVSEASRKGFAASYPRAVMNRGRWEVIYNGVDLERFRPARPTDQDVRAGLSLPPKAAIVCMVGHMRPGKGQHVAIEAWPAVLRSAPEARLVLVGSGPNEDHLRRQVNRLGLADRVIFTGIRDDVHLLLRSSTLAVLPTRMEALPTVLIEAAASGVASVATAVGGVPEVVLDGKTGWLVAAPRADLFARALREALSDPLEVTRRGAAARHRAELHFGARMWATHLRDRYQTACRRRRVQSATPNANGQEAEGSH